MRKRRYVAAAAAAALAAGAAAAATTFANATPEPGAAPETALAVESVTLPTGDTVRQWAGGALEIVPAEGREHVGFIGRTARDGSGDVVVVPADQAAALQSGEEDARRYNVTRLLEHGVADAAALTESELDGLDGRAYEALAPAGDAAGALVDAAAATQTVTVTVRDRSGDAPENALIEWASADSEDYGEIVLDENGTATVELPAGDYLLSTLAWNAAGEDARGEATFGYTAFTVGSKAVRVSVDAAAAEPIGVEVDRADAEVSEFVVAADAENEHQHSGQFEWFDGSTDAYLLPEPETDGYEYEFLYQPELTGGGAEDPYTYHLAFGGSGYPAATQFAVSDAELAIEHTDYQGWGVDVPARQCDYPELSEEQGALFCIAEEFTAPSQRTMLYTAEPAVWTRDLKVGLTENYDLVEGFSMWEDTIALPAGESDRTVGGAALAAGVPSVDRFNIDEEFDNLSGGVFPAATYAGGELQWTGYTGSVTLSRDGEALGESDLFTGFGFDLPAGESARYTLDVQASRGTDTGLYATESAMSWTFDSAPGEDSGVMLPAVLLEAEGVANGAADAAAAQEVALAVAGYGLAEVAVEELAFAVSYDDGATWTEVAIDGDGTAFTATLDHPEGAESVSTRFTGTDTAGTEFALTTIRAWGLR
ncbi:hypothetical protein AB0K52_08750 [Glycomyces sp. NPDC049804]|uniref:hypothetical protein n=1 Tax=Glycomyces sp. NPDC049804 TaxID=3154363 RepID=UPI00342C1C7A